ncbi:MAG: 4Fe-4S binding protein [Clostridiales bacterium]|nr:4Fe-4S binding protein [Clostridiales bacterium]
MEQVTDIVLIKHEVLKATARHAFAGDLYKSYDQIPYEIISGIKPNFRCCVYREREIVRQRVRMGMGKLPREVMYTDSDPSQVVHVIPCACEGCPISEVTVTQNCQGCLAKKCVKACPFGAITTGKHGAVIDKEKCRKCGKCVAACPYHAIVDIERPCKISCPVNAISMDDNDIATIDPAKCINCGACVAGCPFGAISDVSMMTNVIDQLVDEDKHVIAMVAPSIEGQFGAFGLPAIKAAIRKLGFSEVVEVALGADMVAFNEAQELKEHMDEGVPMTSSCCPAFVSAIAKHYPALLPNVSTTVSPMMAINRLVKAENPGAVTVFIGPCIAKKNEAMAHYMGELDYVLTFEELYAMLAAREIEVEETEAAADDATRYGKGFALSGGVTAAVAKVLEEMDCREADCLQCNGREEVKKALLQLKAGRLKVDFIEGMMCDGGCMGGPANLTEFMKSRKVFEKKRDQNGKEEVCETVKAAGADVIDVHRHEK